jgi:RNA polymerase sigma-70 factor (ECF subfamily)
MQNPVSGRRSVNLTAQASSLGAVAAASHSIGQEGSSFAGEPERPTVSDWASALSWGRDETELVTELQAGSETAFDWLVTHYHGPVYNLLLGMLGDVADAADGTQEVFLKAFRGIRCFRQGSSLKTWLYRIAIREALNRKRWFKRHLQRNVSIDVAPEEGHSSIEIEDLGPTPFELLATQEIQAAVQDALRQVAEVFRSAVILRDLEGLSYEEIAEVLECSVGTVKSRILRGRRALKDLLEPLLVDRSAIAHEKDRSAIAHEKDRSAIANAEDAGSAADSGASVSSSRMPRPAFAPSFGSHASTISARSRFSRESFASEDLP